MQIPYDRLITQPYQYDVTSFPYVPGDADQDSNLALEAAVCVANTAGSNAVLNPARIYCFNLLSNNAWHNADFDEVVALVCAYANKKTKLGAYTSPPHALASSAEEILLLYTSALCVSHEGVKAACQPNVKHTAIQNIERWNSLKAELKVYNTPQTHGIIISGYDQIGQPIDQYGQIIPPHLVARAGQQPMVGYPGQPMAPIYQGQQPQQYVPNNMPAFSGAVDPNRTQQQHVRHVQHQQQPVAQQPVHQMQSPSQYMQPMQHQPTRQQQRPAQQQQQPQQPVQKTTQPSSKQSNIANNNVVGMEKFALMEVDVERATHALTALFTAGTSVAGQVAAVKAVRSQINDPVKAVRRRDVFVESIIYSTTITEAAQRVLQLARASQFMETIDEEKIDLVMKTTGVIEVTPIYTYMSMNSIFKSLGKSETFADYLKNVRELGRDHEASLLEKPTDVSSFTLWQDFVTLTETIDRLMTAHLNTWISHGIHITGSVDSLLSDYEETIAFVGNNYGIPQAKMVDELIARIFKNIFSETDENVRDMFITDDDASAGIDLIGMIVIPMMKSMTYVPVVSRSLGAKLKPVFQRISENSSTVLHAMVRQLYEQADIYAANNPNQVPVLQHYLVFDDGMLVEVYRSTSGVPNYYIRSVM